MTNANSPHPHAAPKTPDQDIVNHALFTTPSAGLCQNCGRTLKRKIDTLRAYCTRCMIALGLTRRDDDTPYRDGRLLHPRPEQAIICERIQTRPYANVPRYVMHHSMRGFEWGHEKPYGANDLALNICEHFARTHSRTGPERDCYHGVCLLAAWDMHRDFADEFIRPMRYAGGAIEGETAVGWVLHRLQDNAQ